MAFPTSSPVFERIRADSADGGLSEEQLDRIVAYIDRSPIFTRRIREFEEAGGRIEYETSQKNYFWMNERVPTVYVSPDYKNGDAGEPDIDELSKVIAHEMSHFETYTHGFSPGTSADADGCAAAGSRDEARAYALECLVEREINQSEPAVDWTEEDQRALAREAIEALPPDERTESAMLEAATLKLLDWAANWTGPTIEAGGYFQFYKNYWRGVQAPPLDAVTVSEVIMRCDASGAISELEYTENPGGRQAMVLDAATGKFGPRSA